MDETGLAFSTEDLELQEKQNSAPDSGRRLLIRPTPAETEQIARDCPPRWALGPGDRRRDSPGNRVLARDRVQSGCTGDGRTMCHSLIPRSLSAFIFSFSVHRRAALWRADLLESSLGVSKRRASWRSH
jgi:hypothetical protein